MSKDTTQDGAYTPHTTPLPGDDGEQLRRNREAARAAREARRLGKPEPKGAK